jgi:hypothetical protein
VVTSFQMDITRITFMIASSLAALFGAFSVWRQVRHTHGLDELYLRWNSSAIISFVLCGLFFMIFVGLAMIAPGRLT